MYKQDTTERKLLYKNRKVEYTSGIGLAIGNNAKPARSTIVKLKTKSKIRMWIKDTYNKWFVLIQVK